MRAATRVNAICAVAHIAFYGLFPVMRCTRPIPLWSQGQAAFPQRITVADRVAIVGVSFGKEIRQCSDSTICSSEPTRFSGILLLRWLDPASPTSLTVPSRAPSRPTLRGIAALQVKVIHYLELGEQGKVARPDIEAAARRWVSQDPARRGGNPDVAQRHFGKRKIPWGQP